MMCFELGDYFKNIAGSIETQYFEAKNEIRNKRFLSSLDSRVVISTATIIGSARRKQFN